MLKLGMKIAAAALLAASALTASAHAQDAKKTFYLLSHGGPSDAFWLDWNAGATKACQQLNVTCNISFSGGDMAAQKEAFNSAIAAKPDGIGTTSAQPGLWTAEVKESLLERVPKLFQLEEHASWEWSRYKATRTRKGSRMDVEGVRLTEP